MGSAEDQQQGGGGDSCPHPVPGQWQQAGGPCRRAADPAKTKARPHEASQPDPSGATVLRITPRSTSPRPRSGTWRISGAGARCVLWIGSPPAARRRWPPLSR